MPAPMKYPDELRERATRMAVEARQNVATRPGPPHSAGTTDRHRTAVTSPSHEARARRGIGRSSPGALSPGHDDVPDQSSPSGS